MNDDDHYALAHRSSRILDPDTVASLRSSPDHRIANCAHCGLEFAQTLDCRPSIYCSRSCNKAAILARKRAKLAVGISASHAKAALPGVTSQAINYVSVNQPADIAYLESVRESVRAALTVAIGDVPAVMAGTKKWTREQASLFKTLLDRFMPTADTVMRETSKAMIFSGMRAQTTAQPTAQPSDIEALSLTELETMLTAAANSIQSPTP